MNPTSALTIRLEAIEAYADAHPLHGDSPSAMGRRNLHWRASAPVTRDEAIAIMEETCPSYNEFSPKLLRKLPADAMVTLAREGSVCVYVDKAGTASVKSLKADEFDNDGTNVRIWWD